MIDIEDADIVTFGFILLTLVGAVMIIRWLTK